MSLFVISDLHLSLGCDKKMDVFEGWKDYVTLIEKNWKRTVNKDDTVIVCGDISWGMNLEESFEDFKFLNSLPGEKILLKGNHDFWWISIKTQLHISALFSYSEWWRYIGPVKPRQPHLTHTIWRRRKVPA